MIGAHLQTGSTILCWRQGSETESRVIGSGRCVERGAANVTVYREQFGHSSVASNCVPVRYRVLFLIIHIVICDVSVVTSNDLRYS